MDSEARSKIVAELDRARTEGEDTGPRLIAACVDVLDMTGAGITVMVDDRGPRGSVAASDDAIELVEELQFTLGIGPCVDACVLGEPVLEPNLAHPNEPRWPGLAGPAVEAGVAAIFGFPLRVADVGLGALDVYRDTPGALRPEQHADALVLADVIAGEILEWQAAAAPGALPVELDQSERLRLVVHQAAGLLSVRHGCSVADALARLRAYAYAHGRAVNDVARAVVARSLDID